MLAAPRLLRTGGLTVLLLAGLLAITTLSPIHLQANPSSVTLFGRIFTPAGWGFSSSTVSSPGPDITVLPGETIDPIINSGDGDSHNWGVDYNGNGVIDSGEPLSNTTSTSTSFTFTATSTPGVYTYWCFIHKGPMTGRFIVESPDFSITPNPSSLRINQGSSQTSTITVTSLNGFSGTVTFSAPTAPAGITATLTTSTVSVSSTTPGTTALSVNIAASTSSGGYTVSVTGSGGGNSHTANLSVMVVKPDFAIMSDQSSLSIIVGSSGTDTITLSSQNGFAGNVNLTATVSPSGPTVTLNPVMVALASGGSASSTLTVAAASASAGTYTVNVTAMGVSPLSHSTVLSLTLAPQSSPGPAAGIPAYVLIIAGVVIVAAALIVAFAVLRRRPGK